MSPGQALFEEMRYADGVLLNGEALDYRAGVRHLAGAAIALISRRNSG